MSGAMLKRLLRRWVSTEGEIEKQPCNEVGHNYVSDGFRYRMHERRLVGSNIESITVKMIYDKRCSKCSRRESDTRKSYTIDLTASGPVVRD